MSDLATIERTDVEITETSWKPRGELSFEEWREAGRKLGQIARATQWWIGDWLNYGANAYGEKYVQAVEETGYEVQTLMDFAWVAGKIEISRRREILSWSHHKEVAGLEPDGQDAALDRAAEEGWSRQQLRSVVSGNGKPEKRGQSLTVQVTFEQTFSNKALQKTTMASLRAEAEKLGFTEKG
jgi:hypothetical protein